MDVPENYVKKRKVESSEFAFDFEVGYENFKLGVILLKVRKDAGSINSTFIYLYRFII